MGKNRAYTQQVHHHSPTISSTRTSKSFLPMFCRLSIYDVSSPVKFSDLSSSTEPSSPSCIGQIKKRSNNATTNYHLTATRIHATTTGKYHNYTKLRKLFSGKSLISLPIESTTNSNHGSKCVFNRNRSCDDSVKKKYVTSIEDPDMVKAVVVEELDPPLPVVKVCHREQPTLNLGKRRGIELKTLQIQPFQLSNTRNHKDILLQQPATSSG